MPALSLTDIANAVNNSSVCIKVDELKGGTAIKEHNRLVCFAGNYGAVYKFKMPSGKQKALRVWTKDLSRLPDLPLRAKIISEQFNKINSRYLSSFNFYEKGILVNGNWYPIVVMDWENGSNLKDYLEKNLYSKDELTRLADSFLEMIHDFHERRLSHGDLQHGNIIIDESGNIKLIDYDSIYLPNVGFEQKEEEIKGLPDYQHPNRMQNIYMTEKADYFSELIIYLSIRAIAESPVLWEKYNVSNRDYSLLFDAKDFNNIRNSEIYKDVKALGKVFENLLDALEGYLKCSSINELLPFDTFMLEKQITFKSSATKAIRGKQSVRIMWQVPFEADVTLQQKGSTIVEKGFQGSINVVLDNDAEYTLTIVTKNGVQIIKNIKIRVFDECSIDFSANKEFVFPTLPVKLTWNVTNANRVWIDSEEVKSSGSKVVEPTSDTIYILKAKDEFGEKEKRITVRTIPIKQMKVLLASPPNFTIKQSLTIKQPKYNVDVRFPTINIDWVKVEVPKVLSFTEKGLFRKLSPPLLTSSFSIRRVIKSVFNHIINK